ncbi:MAG: glycosyltransferase family 39 protein [Chloroflexaceae bacterium]|nr:glycosyltransferase family 39 protein [Chloroflexaceae bacterium]
MHIATDNRETGTTRRQFVLSSSAVLLLVLGIGGLFRLLLAWRSLDVLDTLFFPDDTYLSLGIARNIALGYGSTFDRVVLTNGYQPLYVWLMVPVYWLLPNDLLLPIHIALTMLALVGIVTGWLVYLIARHLATPWHGVVAAAIWMLDPRVIGQNLNGLETGIAVLGMAATAYWYLSRIRDHTQIPLWRVAVLGVLAGLTILTRVDQVVFVGASASIILLSTATGVSSGI